MISFQAEHHRTATAGEEKSLLLPNLVIFYIPSITRRPKLVRIKLLLLKIQFYDPNFEQMLQGALNFRNFFFSRLQGLMQRYKNNSLWPPQARKFKNSSYYLCAKITTSIPRKACFIFLVSVVN